MKKIYFLLLLIITEHAYSQDLINSRTTSYFTFIYKITNDEAYTLHEDMAEMDKSYLTNLVDFYPSDSAYKKKLPTGHYLYINTYQGNLNGELVSVNNVNMYLLNNHRDLILSVYDTMGRIVENARVSIRSKLIRWDSKTQTYRDRKSNQKGFICIDYEGHTSLFKIDRVYNNTFLVRGTKKIYRGLAINHIISPLFYLRNNIRNVVQGGTPYPPGIYSRTIRLFKRKPFKGYIAFNKPIYRPGDTVKLKAFISLNKGKRISKQAGVHLRSYYPNYINKKIATIQPFRKGAFEHEFILSDSFKLKLDNQYTISMETRRNKEMVSGQFRYEDYELKQNTYEARSEEDKKGNTQALYLKGFDANKMPLFDARAEIILRTTSVNKFFEKKIFVPDTIWTTTVTLDAVGETKVFIPDTLFPAIDFRYEAIVSFLNAENERTEKRLPLQFNKRSFPVIFKLEKDSLLVSAVEDNLAPIALMIVDAIGKVHTKVVQLPYREKVSPTTQRYQVEHYGDTKMFTILNQDHQLTIAGEKTLDSLLVTTVNPRNIYFRYFLFKNNALIEKGETQNLSIRKKTRPADQYFVSIQYVWGGESHSREYALKAVQRNLDIQVDHPSLVYPGQTIDFTINVRDAKGKPVSNTDITSYAITSKFKNQSIPGVPSFEKQTKNRKIFNEFRENENEYSVSKILEYDLLKKQLGLDSITFYHFLYPDTGYYENRTPADLSQVAPYVVCRGRVKPVEIIYIDGRIVYYKGSENIKPYSFQVSPGPHTITLRTHDSFIRLPDIFINRNEKLILSLDEENVQLPFSIRAEEYKLTNSEISALSRAFILYQPIRPLPQAYLEQSDFFHSLSNLEYYRNDYLIGPFSPGKVNYVQKDGYNLSFEYEPYFGYNFRPGILRLKEAKISSRISMAFGTSFSEPIKFKDVVLTRDKIQKDWIDKPVISFKPIPGPVRQSPRSGKLNIDLTHGIPDSVFIRATYVINLNNPDEYYLYPGLINKISFPEGAYKAIFLLNNHNYITADSIHILPHGINYYKIPVQVIHPADSFSFHVNRLINKWSVWTDNYLQQMQDKELHKARTLYIEQSSEQYSFEHTLSGRILGDDGLPIPGVNVIVKGTTHGTISDINGFYIIKCPSNGVLVFSFIGFQTKEENIQAKSQLDIIMEADVMQLSEVVVVGFGTQSRRDITGSVSIVNALQGRVAGIQINHYTKVMDSVSVRIRGTSSLNNNTEPLVILDGVAVRMSDVDKNLITAMEVLGPDKASSIYGSRASNGVILISTKSGASRDYLYQMSTTFKPVPALEDVDAKSIRDNFRDYAYWKPKLITDHKGQAKFSVTFPDDITGWNAHILAVAPRKKSGQTSTYIQSYKPLMAQITKPNFLVEGDEAILLGKITNYGNEPLSVNRTTETNGLQIAKDKINITNSHIDSIHVKAKGTDSVTVAYTVTVNNYTDGEIRKIPVYRKGVKEVKGVFIPMPRDTSFSIPVSPVKEVTLYAEADLLDVLLNEVRYLKDYPYYCNEQMASRLRAFLIEKDVAEFQKQEFREGNEIEKLIRKITALQNKDGSWGWWKDGNGEPWITLHVGKALMDAEKSGFTGPFNKAKFIDYLGSVYPQETGKVKSEIARLLLEEGIKVLPDRVDSLTRSRLSMRNRIEYERLMQLAGNTPDWKWINQTRSETIKGNVYWGEESTRFFDNAIQNTLIVYKMKEKENKNNPELADIRNYFLEIRKKTWRNTYESALILETLLPALLREKHRSEKPTLLLTGIVEKRVDQFPFELKVSNPGTLKIEKTGASPVYFTAYEEMWNTQPEPVDKDFTVTTCFAEKTGLLQAGKPVKLTVVVKVKKATEFVQIDIPIPAGCSYNTKSSSRTQGEVYREYFLHKTSVFCRYLDKGEYSYTIDLLPRYSGKYSLNPALAECMYFPTLYGREGLQMLEIK